MHEGRQRRRSAARRGGVGVIDRLRALHSDAGRRGPRLRSYCGPTRRWARLFVRVRRATWVGGPGGWAPDRSLRILGGGNLLFGADLEAVHRGRFRLEGPPAKVKWSPGPGAWRVRGLRSPASRGGGSAVAEGGAEVREVQVPSPSRRVGESGGQPDRQRWSGPTSA